MFRLLIKGLFKLNYKFVRNIVIICAFLVAIYFIFVFIWNNNIGIQKFVLSNDIEEYIRNLEYDSAIDYQADYSIGQKRQGALSLGNKVVEFDIFYVYADRKFDIFFDKDSVEFDCTAVNTDKWWKVRLSYDCGNSIFYDDKDRTFFEEEIVSIYYQWLSTDGNRTSTYASSEFRYIEVADNYRIARVDLIDKRLEPPLDGGFLIIECTIEREDSYFKNSNFCFVKDDGSASSLKNILKTLSERYGDLKYTRRVLDGESETEYYCVSFDDDKFISINLRHGYKYGYTTSYDSELISKRCSLESRHTLE